MEKESGLCLEHALQPAAETSRLCARHSGILIRTEKIPNN